MSNSPPTWKALGPTFAEYTFEKVQETAEDYFTELQRPLDQFFREFTEKEQLQVLAEFTATLKDEDRISPETHEKAEKALEALEELDDYFDTAQPSSDEKKTGDKWVSPGRLVCTWPDLDLTARAVLFVMAAHGRDDGTNCFVSQSTIAEYLGLSQVETVRRAWRRLEDAGAIRQTAKATQQKPPTYRINRGSRVV